MHTPSYSYSIISKPAPEPSVNGKEEEIPPVQLFARAREDIRMVSWNCQGLRIADNPGALRALADFFKTFDVVLLQEVGSGKGGVQTV